MFIYEKILILNIESFPIIKDYNKVEIADRLQTDLHSTLWGMISRLVGFGFCFLDVYIKGNLYYISIKEGHTTYQL